MRRWHILTLGDTAVYLHPAVLIYAIYACLTGNGLFMAISTLSILLHEAAHAMTAKRVGIPPAGIELTPLGAIMHLSDGPRLSAGKRTAIWMAGPLMTLVLCCLSLQLTKLGVLPFVPGRTLFLSNLSILVVNMLPALPLDGGSLLSLLLEQCLPLSVVRKCMRIIGSLLGIVLIMLNICVSWKMGGWNLSLAFAGCCLLYSAVAATRTLALAELYQFMDRKISFEKSGRQKICWIAVSGTTPIRAMLKRLPTGRLAMYAVLEPGSMRICGWISEYEAVQHYLDHPQQKYAEVVKFHPEHMNMPQKDTI